MRTLLTVFLFAVFIISCGEKTPRDVLSFNEMKSVMWDMMRADQFVSDYILAKDSSRSKIVESSKWYGQVLAIHHISQKDFRNSYNYYSSHPALMRNLMDSLANIVDTTTTWQQRRLSDTTRGMLKTTTAE
jgi:hypothetical protein